jgi:hypothetical protein
MANKLDGKNVDYLNDYGTSKGVFESMDSLTNTQKLITKIANKFIKKAQSKIKQAKAIDQGNMLDIKILDNELSNKKIQLLIGYTIDNPAVKYWKYQDSGVAGTKKDRSKGSPYKFEKETVGGEFLENLIQWYRRHKNYISNETQTKGLSGLQKKRKKLGSIDQDKIKTIAYLTGRKIKREGLKSIQFSKYAEEQTFTTEFFVQLARELGNDFLDNLQK